MLVIASKIMRTVVGDKIVSTVKLHDRWHGEQCYETYVLDLFYKKEHLNIRSSSWIQALVNHFYYVWKSLKIGE